MLAAEGQNALSTDVRNVTALVGRYKIGFCRWCAGDGNRDRSQEKI